MADLREVIQAFAAAETAYRATTEGDSLAWETYEAAEHAVIVYPCRTIEDARLKARFFLDNPGPNDTLRNCFSEGGHTLDLFLGSLVGEESPCG